MSPTERIGDWVHNYQASRLKMNCLLAIYENEGERVLVEVMKRIGLASPLDVVKACKNDWTK